MRTVPDCHTGTRVPVFPDFLDLAPEKKTDGSGVRYQHFLDLGNNRNFSAEVRTSCDDFRTGTGVPVRRPRPMTKREHAFPYGVQRQKLAPNAYVTGSSCALSISSKLRRWTVENTTLKSAVFAVEARRCGFDNFFCI